VQSRTAAPDIVILGHEIEPVDPLHSAVAVPGIVSQIDDRSSLYYRSKITVEGFDAAAPDRESLQPRQQFSVRWPNPELREVSTAFEG